MKVRKENRLTLVFDDNIVVDNKKMEFWDVKIEEDSQDNNKTLKLFIRRKR